MNRGWLRFVADGVCYALPLLEVREMVPLGPLSRIPRGPRGAVGITSHQGGIYTVMDLTVLRGGQGPARIPPLALILDGPARVALGADRVEGLGTLPDDGAGVEVLEKAALLAAVDLAFQEASVLQLGLRSEADGS